MKNHKMKKTMLMLAGVTLLTGATLVATSGCSNDYRGTTIYRPAYFSPYDYYYYPYWSVYFNISTGYYYYRDGSYMDKGENTSFAFHSGRQRSGTHRN